MVATLLVPSVGRMSIIDMAYDNIDFKKDTFVSSFYIKGHFKNLIFGDPRFCKAANACRLWTGER